MAHFFKKDRRDKKLFEYVVASTFFNKMDSASFSLFFRLFNAVDSQQINIRKKSLPTSGFERRTSGVGRDRSTN